MGNTIDLPPGALEMLIFKASYFWPLHGHGILLRIEPISWERLEILLRSFCTANYRLERRDWMRGQWGESENNRKTTFDRLTHTGKCPLKEVTEKWTDMASPVANILQAKAERA
jgi:PadR family transcriptional regulator, regulatory protein PadR